MAIPVLLLVTVIFCVYVVYHYILYPLAISPLSRIPNAHPTAGLSPAWILWIRYVGRENATVYDAHKRLGPMVRLGPSEISVNCVDGGIRTIYSGGYEKGTWYSNVFACYGEHCMFSMEKREPHAARKRMLGNIYAKSVLQASPAMAEILEEILCRRTLPCIANAPNGIIDAYELLSAITMDGVTAYLFGLSQSSNHIQSGDLGAKWLRNYEARKESIFWPQELPILMKAFDLVGLGHLLVPEWVGKVSGEIEAWNMGMCEAAETAIVRGTVKSPGDQPTVYKQLRSSAEKQSKSGAEQQGKSPTSHQMFEIASELLDHLAAGFDTSGITLTYLAWELSRPHNAHIQKALREELLSLKPVIRAAENPDDRPPLPSPKEIDALPMLHAVVTESLRLHAAIPGGQPRVTPANATLGPPGSEVHGIPAGVRVVSYAHSLHRNPEVFPDPEKWLPERWLDSQGQVTTGGEKNRWFWAFGSGSRMCIGSNLALMEMKHIVATIWSNYSTSVVDDTGMVHMGRYTDEPVGSPEGNYLLMQFERI